MKHENKPTLLCQFISSMEETVSEAKMEIEAFVEHKIRSTGLHALGFNRESDTPMIELQNGDNEQ